MLAAFFLIAAFALVASVQVFADDAYTVSGVWVLNETPIFGDVDLAGQLFLSLRVNFVSNSYSFTSFQVYPDPFRVCFLVPGTTMIEAYTINNGWLDEAYRTIDFGETEQAVSAEFYAWLNENATFQAPPPAPGPLVEATTKVDLTAVLLPILTMIPIGLAFLVCYKGFWKGLALLRKVLSGA